MQVRSLLLASYTELTIKRKVQTVTKKIAKTANKSKHAGESKGLALTIQGSDVKVKRSPTKKMMHSKKKVEDPTEEAEKKLPGWLLDLVSEDDISIDDAEALFRQFKHINRKKHPFKDVYEALNTLVDDTRYEFEDLMYELRADIIDRGLSTKDIDPAFLDEIDDCYGTLTSFEIAIKLLGGTVKGR